MMNTIEIERVRDIHAWLDRAAELMPLLPGCVAVTRGRPGMPSVFEDVYGKLSPCLRHLDQPNEQIVEAWERRCSPLGGPYGSFGERYEREEIERWVKDKPSLIAALGGESIYLAAWIGKSNFFFASAVTPPLQDENVRRGFVLYREMLDGKPSQPSVREVMKVIEQYAAVARARMHELPSTRHANSARETRYDVWVLHRNQAIVLVHDAPLSAWEQMFPGTPVRFERPMRAADGDAWLRAARPLTSGKVESPWDFVERNLRDKDLQIGSSNGGATAPSLQLPPPEPTVSAAFTYPALDMDERRRARAAAHKSQLLAELSRPWPPKEER